MQEKGRERGALAGDLHALRRAPGSPLGEGRAADGGERHDVRGGPRSLERKSVRQIAEHRQPLRRAERLAAPQQQAGEGRNEPLGNAGDRRDDEGIRVAEAPLHRAGLTVGREADLEIVELPVSRLSPLVHQLETDLRAEGAECAVLGVHAAAGQPTPIADPGRGQEDLGLAGDQADAGAGGERAIARGEARAGRQVAGAPLRQEGKGERQPRREDEGAEDDRGQQTGGFGAGAHSTAGRHSRYGIRFRGFSAAPAAWRGLGEPCYSGSMAQPFQPTPDASEASQDPVPPTESPDGVDLTLIRWTLSLTPLERLELLQDWVDGLTELRHGRAAER